MDTLVNIFPSNFIQPMAEGNMLQIIVMALLLGFAIILVGEEAAVVVKAVNALNSVFMKCMEMILKLSPVGVFCLLCPGCSGKWSGNHMDLWQKCCLLHTSVISCTQRLFTLQQ